MKNIAVLTSGGDSPGMNAALRAVVRTAIYNQLNVYGVYNGYTGLIDNNIQQLNIYSVADRIQRGGTFISTSREERMKTEEGLRRAAENLSNQNIAG
jgi:6-phosphofructokinase 1